MQIVIEAAGDHRFDLNHLRQEGAEELLEQALRRAGQSEHTWRVQVQKKVTCNAETRPLAVVGFKPWCCYVKIKPGDNNSAHFCTVLMPPGFRGDDVFRALKSIEDQIDRNWRFASDKKSRPTNGTAADAAVPCPESPPTPEEVDFAALVEDAEKVRLVLLAVHEVGRRGPHSGPAEFAAGLAAEMGWRRATGNDVAGVMTALFEKRLLDKAMLGSRQVGYRLSARGREVVGDLLPSGLPECPATPPPVELSFDPTGMLGTFAALAREYADAATTLRQNRERRAELIAEVEALDAEARSLQRKVNDPRVKALMRQLLGPATPGVRSPN